MPGITSAIGARRVRRHPGDAPRAVDPLHRRHRPRGPGEGPHRRRLGRAGARRRHARDPDGRGPHRRDRRARSIDGGRAPDTPVAAVRNGTRPDQRTVRATLGDDRRRRRAVAERDRGRRRSPRSTSAWFEQRPLFGRSVVVTRAREQASELRARLEALGAEVIELPAIAIEPLDFDAARPRRLRVAGVHVGERRATRSSTAGSRRRASTPARSRGLRVAAIGPGTARALAARGMRADLVPERFVAESLLEAFPDAGARRRARAARPRRARRATCCPRASAQRGYAVDVLAVYRTVPGRARRRRRSRACAPARSTRSRSRRRRRSTNFCDLRRRRSPTRSRSWSRSARSPRRPRVERGLRVDAEADRTPSTASSTLVARRALSASERATTRRSGTIAAMAFPEQRMRRLRRTPALRRLVAEAPAVRSTTSSPRCS